ncbi:MAG: hypothetical protein IT220_00625 [Flavobacteriaceae bacterium]|nr:hypothetical protein [Flavobacteriaceae bacterium]
MNKFFIIIALGCIHWVQAQNKSYENEVIGWKKVYNFTPATKAFSVDEKTYSSTQISIAGEIANWMQMSYTPKGALGDVKKTVLPKLGLYNSYVKVLPHSYGAVVYSYTFLIKDAQNKWTNETSHANQWRIVANEVPNADYYGIPFLNSDKEFYFILPVSEEIRWDNMQENTENHPILKKYYNKTLPDFGGASNAKLVIMSKDNIFPFQQLNIGEVLTLTEKSLSNWFEIEKKKIAEANQYPANKNLYKTYEFDLNQATEKVTAAKNFLKQLKTKYQNKLTDAAYINNGKFDLIDLVNQYDIFSGNETTLLPKYFPVYKIKPEFLAKCSTDQPQWISILWSGGTLDEVQYRHLNQSILNHFDFDYLYHYLFDKGIIKTQKYQPLQKSSK